MIQVIADMNVQCSLKIRNIDAIGLAFSDCCQARATHAVIMSGGAKMWRCFDHRNVRGVDSRGYLDVGSCVTEVEIKGSV